MKNISRFWRIQVIYRLNKKSALSSPFLKLKNEIVNKHLWVNSLFFLHMFFKKKLLKVCCYWCWNNQKKNFFIIIIKFVCLLLGDLFDMLLPMLSIYQEYVRNHHYSLQVYIYSLCSLYTRSMWETTPIVSRYILPMLSIYQEYVRNHTIVSRYILPMLSIYQEYVRNHHYSLQVYIYIPYALYIPGVYEKPPL